MLYERIEIFTTITIGGLELTSAAGWVLVSQPTFIDDQYSYVDIYIKWQNSPALICPPTLLNINKVSTQRRLHQDVPSK